MQNPDPILPPTPPLRERIAAIVGTTVEPDEPVIDERARLLSEIHQAVEDDDQDAACAALWELTKLLNLTDQVNFELDTE